MTEPIASQPDPPNYQHARDIPDVVFLAAIEETIRRCSKAAGFPHSWATRWDLAYTLGGLPYSPQPFDDVAGVPMKVLLAKFRRVNRRGLVEGCDCGCRGDFELTSKGRELLFDALIADTDVYLAAVEVFITVAGVDNDKLTAIGKGIRHSVIHQLGLTATALSGAATELDYYTGPRIRQ